MEGYITMSKPMIRITNIISTVVTIFLPLIFVITNIFNIIMIFGNSIILILTLLLFSITGIVSYITSLIQGFRAIKNGQVGAYKYASLFQIILYFLDSILSIVILIVQRNTFYTFSSNLNKIFLVIFSIIITFAIVRLRILKNQNNSDIASIRMPNLSKTLVNLFIVLPIVTATVTIMLYRLLEKNEALRKTIILCLTIGLVLFGIAIALLIIGLLSNIPFLDASEANPVVPPKKPEPPKTLDNKATDAEVEEFNNRYRRLYKSITKSSPDLFDWRVIKEGPERNAVLALRKRMQNEAKQKGIKSKYF